MMTWIRLPPRTQAKLGSSSLRMGMRSPICQCLSNIWLWSHLKLRRAPGHVKLETDAYPGQTLPLGSSDQ